MSPEERQVLVELFQRTNAAASQPRDRDAEAFIAEAVRLQPYAPYLLAQAVLLQEQAMKQASDRSPGHLPLAKLWTITLFVALGSRSSQWPYTAASGVKGLGTGQSLLKSVAMDPKVR